MRATVSVHNNTHVVLFEFFLVETVNEDATYTYTYAAAPEVTVTHHSRRRCRALAMAAAHNFEAKQWLEGLKDDDGHDGNGGDEPLGDSDNEPTNH